MDYTLYAMPDTDSGEHSPIEPATYQDPSIALHVPEPAAYMYQDYATVRETAPTGDLYTIIHKKQANDAPTEPPTYQDPATIQCETAPTGDLYAIPDKNVAKQVHSMYHILWHSKPC